MKRVSVEQAFLWAQRFAAREWRLLLPVVMAFLVLPPLLVDLLAPKLMRDALVAATPGARPHIPVGALAVMALVLLVSLAGQLVIVSLALVPRISVREAIGRAFARLGVVLTAGLFLFVVVLVAALAVATVLSLIALDPASQQAILVGLMFGAMVVIWVRLSMLGPLVIDRPLGPPAAIKQALALSHGTFWRLLGGIAVYTVGATVVVFALSSALGTILTLAAKMAGQPEIGVVLATVLLRVVAAIGTGGLQLLLVGFYRQLAGSNTAI